MIIASPLCTPDSLREVTQASVWSVRGGPLQTGHQYGFRIISCLIECLMSAEAVYVVSRHVYSARSTYGSGYVFPLVCLCVVCVCGSCAFCGECLLCLHGVCVCCVVFVVCRVQYARDVCACVLAHPCMSVWRPGGHQLPSSSSPW